MYQCIFKQDKLFSIRMRNLKFYVCICECNVRMYLWSRTCVNACMWAFEEIRKPERLLKMTKTEMCSM
jgi:hypothetical protein